MVIRNFFKEFANFYKILMIGFLGGILAWIFSYTFEDLLKQEYIRDSAKNIEELVKETIAKVGENIVIRRFMRFELGE